MIFELTTETECELTSFTGRVQKDGPGDRPAVTFRLKLFSASNTLLDKFSPTIRHTAYMAVEGQEQLPGVEPTTPILRSKDLKHWTCETVHNGWTVTLTSRDMNSPRTLRMGSCKVDNFNFDLYEGGSVDLEFRVSTADVDEAGAGMLWGRQKCAVFVLVEAPELPEPAIDGSVEAFKKDHPDAGDAQGDLLTPENALQASLDDDAPMGDPDEHGGDNGDDDSEGGTADAEREQAELEAGMAASLNAAGVKPKRGRVAH